MHESPYKPKFVLIVDIEPVAAHYYAVAGLSPLYLTAQDGVNTDEALARTYSSRANAARAGERARRSLWGIQAFHVEQASASTNDGPNDVKARTP